MYRRKRPTRVMRKKRPFNMRRKLRSPQTTYVKRTVLLSSINGADGTPDFGQGLTFRLQDLPNYTEMSNLFERYTIKKISYRWYVEQDPNNQTIKKFPTVSWVNSYTSSGAPTALNQIQQYPTYRKHMFTESRPMTRLHTLRPASLTVNYATGVSSTYNAKWGQFLTTADAQAQWYGLAIWIDNLQTGVTLQLEATYHIQLRGVK